MTFSWHVLAIGAVIAGTAASAGAQAAAVGAEFQVNSYTTNYQGAPKLCRADGGSFIVVWRSESQDGDVSGIFGQRYDSTGITQGAEFQVNSYTTGAQSFVAVACGGSGDFVSIWHGAAQDGDGLGVFGQRFSSAGAMLGTEFLVNTYTTGDQSFPGVAADDGGDFLVVWTSAGQDGDSSGVYGQRYDSAGAAQGAEFLVNTYTTGAQSSALCTPAACDDNLNCVVTWTSFGQDGDQNGVFAQRFISSGAMQGAEFQVNSYTTSIQDNPAAARDADGDFVIAWRSMGQDGAGYGIFGQRFSTSGAPQGAEFQVNAYTTGGQSFPAVATNDAGEFVIAWASDGQDGNSSGVFAQQFDSLGAQLGSEFQVNTTTAGFQSLEAVAADAKGDFVITWISGSAQDGDGFGVFAQRYEVPLCTPGPRATCLGGTSLKPFFLMRASTVLSRQKVTWKWLRGAQTDLADFGDPINSTSYALCVYDETGGVPSLRATLIIPPSANWEATGTHGFKYKDDAGTQAGIRKIQLKADEGAKAKVIVKGKGAGLPLPAPASTSEFLDQDTDVVVQLVNSEGECWTSTFPAPALKNTDDTFRDKEE